MEKGDFDKDSVLEILHSSRHPNIVLSERDYMRRPVEPAEKTEAQQSPELPPSPKPFNIFEGVPQEPLSSVDTSTPSDAVQKQQGILNGASASLTSEKTSESIERSSLNSTYIVIAVVALILGVIIGIVLK